MIKLFEMFTGYGGASFSLKKAGIPFECVGYSEIDKYAIQCFQQNHIRYLDGYGKNFGDCREINVDNLPDFDLLTGGFPCQSFSQAGKMKGEVDSRGTLFQEIIRIAEAKKPKYMLLENVKGLTCKRFKDTFDKILSELNRIGYNVYWKVLNSKDFGIPQSRARVWFVCFRKEIDKPLRFQFPELTKLNLFVKDLLQEDVEEKYFLTEKVIKRLFDSSDLIKKFSIINPEIAIPEMARQYANWKGNFIVAMRQKDNLVMNCIGTCFGRRGTSQEERDMYKKVLLSSGQLRRLTPKECFRLMGFLNDEINLDGLSDTQRYKLAGNGWEINLASKILKEMFK